MRGRTVGILLLAAALCSGTAAAVDVNGWIGGSGTRLDAWTPPHDSLERLHLDAGLNAAGFVLSPEDIDWRGSLKYGRDRASYTGSHADGSVVTYDADASLFDTRSSSFALRLGGSRSQSDLSQSSAGTGFTGTTLTNSLSASARTGGGPFPSLEVGTAWIDSTNSGPDRPDVRRTLKQLDASSGHGGEGYSYLLSYSGRIETGSLPSLDYTSQSVAFTSRAQVTAGTEVGLFGQHFTRTPSTSAETNPKYDDTMLSAHSWTTLPNFRLGTRYTFGHFLFESSTLPATERFNHSFTLTGDRTLTPEWSLAPSVGVSYTQDRVGAAETTAAGQSVGATSRWIPRLEGRSLVVEGGARVGLLEPAEGATALGWGGSAACRYDASWGRTRYGGSYRIDYDKDMNAIEGWTLRQAASADMSRQLARTLSMASSLSVTAARNNAPLTGGSASRGVALTAGLQWPSVTVGLAAGLADGVAGSLSNPVRGDALFVPLAFQTHSRNVALDVGAVLGSSWTVNGVIRYAFISGPDVPTQHELIYAARARYRIGQFILSFDDTYRTVGAGISETRVNELMITFARTFAL